MSNSAPTFIETQPASAVAFNWRPQKDIITSLLLINITDKPILFKLRTTAPTCYVVKPNFGMLLPSQIIDVSITMQASDFDSCTSSKNDRFQVNAVLCPDGIDPAYIVANSSEFQHVFDLMPKGQKQAKNLTVEFLLESGENVGSGKRESIVTQEQKSVRFADQSSLSDDSAGLRNENSTSFFSVNTSSLAPKKEVVNAEKKKQDDFYKQRIAFLQKNVDKLTAENQMLKIKNQDIMERSLKQEKLVQELTEEKQVSLMEVTTLKSTTFKKRNAKEKIQESLMAGFEFWHILSICIIGLILGKIIMSFVN